MTFGQSYLTHMKCLENVGMLGIKPVMHQGKEIIPIEFLKPYFLILQVWDHALKVIPI